MSLGLLTVSTDCQFCPNLSFGIGGVEFGVRVTHLKYIAISSQLSSRFKIPFSIRTVDGLLGINSVQQISKLRISSFL